MSRRPPWRFISTSNTGRHRRFPWSMISHSGSCLLTAARSRCTNRVGRNSACGSCKASAHSCSLGTRVEIVYSSLPSSAVVALSIVMPTTACLGGAGPCIHSATASTCAASRRRTADARPRPIDSARLARAHGKEPQAFASALYSSPHQCPTALAHIGPHLRQACRRIRLFQSLCSRLVFDGIMLTCHALTCRALPTSPKRRAAG